MEETWLYHYSPGTKQQSVECRHCSALLPKHSECKNPLEMLSPPFFGIKTASSSFIIFQRAKQSTRNISHIMLVRLKDILKKKCRVKLTKGVLFLHDNAPAQRVLATQKKLGYLDFQCLDHTLYSPDQAPSHCHLFPD